MGLFVVALNFDCRQGPSAVFNHDRNVLAHFKGELAARTNSLGFALVTCQKLTFADGAHQ